MNNDSNGMEPGISDESPERTTSGTARSRKFEAVTEFRADVSAVRLFEAWLDPAKVRLWMAAALREMGLEGDMRVVEIDANVDGRFLVSDLRNGVEARHWGEYRQIRKPEIIEFTWVTDPAEEPDPSVVRLSITGEGDGCIARIVHVVDSQWEPMAARIAASWQRMIRHAAGVA